MPQQARRIAILGSTGSIGTQTLDVVQRLGGRIEIVALAAHRNIALLAEQARRWDVRHLCVADEETAARLSGEAVPPGSVVYSGRDGLTSVATLPDVDTVVVAVAGAVGIEATHAAIASGKTIALASKEVLVAAGEHTMQLAREHGTSIVPIDSEHSAIFQCLQGAPPGSVAELILTASGGPFLRATVEQMREATPDEALRHPTWNMGGLVTVNSATLMNKGLEIIEACRLFNMPPDRVHTLIHPQSIVHSLIRFVDGSVLAQMGLPDMRLPIQYALLYPERLDTGLPRLELADWSPLTFEQPDDERFPAISIAREALAAGGTMPAVMNGANEEAVAMFLERRLRFFGIMEVVHAVMNAHVPGPARYAEILTADRWARSMARSLVDGPQDCDNGTAGSAA
ncbi:MAG: 1-deoxy-D-xylulose-5-phosphate reductoisomerase [Chthonomonadales bacterium]|nr:1-deoxy-D-xylulose-5-phosphate reductoisomerase [Chthonomonadales bacterium]